MKRNISLRFKDSSKVLLSRKPICIALNEMKYGYIFSITITSFIIINNLPVSKSDVIESCSGSDLPHKYGTVIFILYQDEFCFIYIYIYIYIYLILNIAHGSKELLNITNFDGVQFEVLDEEDAYNAWSCTSKRHRRN
jgi:hypothetical protein